MASGGGVTPNLVAPQLIENILEEFTKRTQEALIFLPSDNLKYYPMITTSTYFSKVSCILYADLSCML